MPGVYTYGKVAFDETGAQTIKPVTRIRGGDAKKYAAKIKINQWLIENVLSAWRKPFDPRKPETFPAHCRRVSKLHHCRECARLARPVEAGRPVDGKAGGARRWHA